jgi:hypothetical protein
MAILPSRHHRLLRTSTFATLLAALVVYADPVADATHGLISLPTLVRRTAPPVSWQGVLEAGSTLEVTGVTGPIVAAPADGNVAEVVAERSARREDPAEVSVRVVPTGGGLTVCALYPSAPAGPAGAGCRRDDHDDLQVRREPVRVAFRVRVPAGVRLVARTVDGDLTALGIDGPVSLTTVNGAVTFATSAYGDAHTVNGSIRGAMGRTDWPQALTLETVNGSIAVDLPTAVDTELYAHARYGETTTSFPLASPARAGRALATRLGTGGRMLRLLTVNGSIRVRRR